MYKIDVEKRNTAVKAKKLKKNGQIPCSINAWGAAGEAMLVTLPEATGRKLLKEKGKGGVVTLQLAEESIEALIKDITMNSSNRQIDDITFQRLTLEKPVASSAKVLLTNKDMIPTLVQLLLPEIPYEALPAHIVETITIDLSKHRPGDQITVGDLDISSNPDITLTVDTDRPVLSISGNQRTSI
ncbi:MAG: hypothetical protein PHG16_06410 [Lachnospiraceae bacterium]|nr:hypothetical protein [Lachnospiraceae bacterium]